MRRLEIMLLKDKAVIVVVWYRSLIELLGLCCCCG